MMHTIISVTLVCVFGFGILYNIGDAPEWMGHLLLTAFAIYMLPKWLDEIRGWFKDIAKDAIKESKKNSSV